MSSKYDGQVEVVVAPFIVNDDGKLLLVRSSKWGDRWLCPGGHVEYGETIAETAEREGEEETGLKVKCEHVINLGELVFDPAFHRQAHLIYIHVRCHVVGGVLKVDGREIVDAKWFDPKEALKLSTLSESVRESVENLMAGVRLEPKTRRWKT